MKSVNEQEIDWSTLCDFIDEIGTSSVAMNKFDVIESNESLSGIRTSRRIGISLWLLCSSSQDFDVNGENIATSSGGKV